MKNFIGFQRFNSLPQHLWEVIMAWLPPRSLLRCMSVSKSWRAHIASLIPDPSFVAKYLRNAARPHRGRNLVICLPPPPHWNLLVVAFDGGRLGRECIGAGFFHLGLRMRSASHCDGIVFVEFWDGKAILCNPAMNEWKMFTLPSRLSLLSSGFGYDSEAREYKLVLFEYKNWRTTVYNLSTDSWTVLGTAGLELDHTVIMPLTIMGSSVIFSKGRCYFPVLGPKYTLISFDLSREEFRVVPLPDGHQLWERSATLAAWKDGLAVITFSPANKPIEIWAAVAGEEGGGSGIITRASWTKKHCIYPGPFWSAVIDPFSLRFWTDDELFAKDDKGRLLSCDLRSGEFRYLTISGLNEVKLSSMEPFCWPIPCVESLVSVQKRS